MEPITPGERALAAVCLLGGIGIVFMAADILTGGYFTRSLLRTGPAVAAERITREAAAQ